MPNMPEESKYRYGKCQVGAYDEKDQGECVRIWVRSGEDGYVEVINVDDPGRKRSWEVIASAGKSPYITTPCRRQEFETAMVEAALFFHGGWNEWNPT